MIDTVKFKVPVSRILRSLIIRRSVEIKKRSVASGFVDFVFWRVEQKLGSFNRNVNFFITDDDLHYITFELSLPKYLYGNNVVLLGWHEISSVVSLLYADFVRFFGDFAPPTTWEVLRADFCYAWKLDTLDDCIKVLQVFDRYKNARQKKQTHETSIFYSSKGYALKFYVKGSEFRSHDFNDMFRSGNSKLASYLLDYSESVLRFEISLKLPILQYHLEKKHIYIKDLTKRFIYNILRKYYKRYLKGMNTKFLNNNQVLMKLRENYGKIKASHLYTFYLLSLSSDKQHFLDFCSSFDPSTIRRKYIDLRTAGVGLPLLDIKKNYDLSIPSTCQVIDGSFLPTGVGKNEKASMRSNTAGSVQVCTN